MYYVGQLHDIRHGCVYTSIEEARKEMHRNLQTGQVYLFTVLPKSKDYYIVGTVGQNSNSKFNLIFTDSDAGTALDQAKAHLASLEARGWPKRDLCFKKLDVADKGPAEPDVRTQEHLDTEKRLQRILRAIERGIMVTNKIGATMELLLVEDEPNTAKLIYNHGQFGVMALDNWETIDPTEVYSMVRNLRALCGEVANVDPDTQPRKWARLQQQANELWSTPLRLPDFIADNEDIIEQEQNDALANPPADDSLRNN
jgi:hypothetical protein